MNDKLKTIICHIFLLGWIIGLVLYLMGDKTPLTRFYLRQTLGIHVLGIIPGYIPGVIGMLLGIAVFAIWVYSLVGAIQNREQEIPIIGPYFQQWFTFI